MLPEFSSTSETSVITSGLSPQNANLLDTTWDVVKNQLRELALAPDAYDRLDSVFDISNPNVAHAILSDWSNGIFPDLPTIQIVADSVLSGSGGAYAAQTGTIYLSESTVQDPLLGRQILAEEFGHHLDVLLNPGADTLGDEGEFFSRVLFSDEINTGELARLRTEDDHGVINLDGTEIAVEFDNTTGTAVNIGTLLNGTRTDSGWVGTTDTNDFVRFFVGASSRVNLRLAGMSADADLILRNSAGTEITRSELGGSTAESILRTLNRGTYYAQVRAFGTANTSYSLSFTTEPIDSVGNSFTFARNIGTLYSSSTFNTSDWVGSNDNNDFYRFDIGSSRTVNFALTNLLYDADLTLFNSGGSVVARSTSWGTSDERFSRWLGAGTYYVRVNREASWTSGSSLTPYVLSLSAF